MANQVTLFGNLGQDPELKYTPSGKAVAAVSLATTEVWFDNQGQKQENTDWHRIIFWEKQAETVAKYLRKGSKLFVQGRISYREYTDRENVKRNITEIIAKNMEFAGPFQAAQPQSQPPAQHQPANSMNSNGQHSDPTLDSIPF